MVGPQRTSHPLALANLGRCLAVTTDLRYIANVVTGETLDIVSSETRSRIMARVPSKHTSPEMSVRKLLYAQGFRYRLHRRDPTRQPDIVLPGRRTVVFVHGCFWHGHVGCQKGALPKSNLAYWTSKIAVNRERDHSNSESLKALGWKVVVIWQCQIRELKAHPCTLMAAL